MTSITFRLLLFTALTFGLVNHAAALTIYLVKNGADERSSSITVETFSKKGISFRQQVKFGADGRGRLSIKATSPQLYWVSGAPLYLYPDDEVTVVLPPQPKTTMNSSGFAAVAPSMGSADQYAIVSIEGKHAAENKLLLELNASWKLQEKKYFGDSSFTAIKSIEAEEQHNRVMIQAGTKDKALQSLALFLNDMNSLKARSAFTTRHKGTFVYGDHFFTLIDKLSLEDPYLDYLPPIVLTNYVGSYYRMVMVKSKQTDPAGFNKARYLLEHVNSPRIINQEVGQFVSLRFRSHGIDESLLNLLPLAKEKITDTAVLREIEEKEKGYGTIYKDAMAPAFTLMNADNKPVSLADYAGKVVAIDVWATWCSACVKELPSFLALRETYRSNPGIVFITVSTDSPGAETKWRDFLKKKNMNGIDLVTIRDEKNNFRKAYSITGIPRYMIIDKQGKMVVSHGPKPSSVEYRNLLETTLKAN